MSALAAAYALVSRDNWTDVPLRDVLLEELRPFAANGTERYTLSGAPVFLRPHGALALGMIMHELVTNAVKHGALLVPGGTISLRWQVDPRDGEKRLICDWTEQNELPVTLPDRCGFGLLLRERSMKYELKGVAAVTWHREGLTVTLTMPLDAACSRRGAARYTR